MGCPKIVRCAACLLVSYRPLGAKTEEHGTTFDPMGPGAAGTQPTTMEDKQAYKNNRLDYHAAGSYDVCRFNTRM